MAYRPDDLDRAASSGGGDLDDAAPPEGVNAASNVEASGTSSLQDATVIAQPTTAEQAEGVDTGVSPPADATDEVEAARAEIEQTRAEMSETIDAIQEKLSPDTIKEEVKEAVKEATIGKVEQTVSAATSRAAQTADTARDQAAQTVGAARDSVAQTVSAASGAGPSAARKARRNLIPVLLIGLGVAGLAIGGSRVREYRQRRARIARSSRAGKAAIQAQQRVSVVAGQARGKVAQLRERAGRAPGKVKDVPDRGAPFQARMEVIRDRVARVARRGQDQAQETLESRPRRGSSGLLEDTPLAVIDLIAALAVAVALAVLRRARRERWF